MKHTYFILSCLLLKSAVAVAQPRYAPEVRAKREVQWMQDSLGITQSQAAKAAPIELVFNRQMDKAILIKDQASRIKKEQYLMHKEDKHMKALLNKQQYDKYCRHAAALRAQQQQQPHGIHRAL